MGYCSYKVHHPAYRRTASQQCSSFMLTFHGTNKLCSFMQIEKFILQPFGYEFVGSDWGLEVFNVEVLIDGDLLRETGVREGPAEVNRFWGAIEVAF